MSPLANALNTVSGMMCMKNSTVLWPCAFDTYCAIALVSSVDGSILKPTPGLSRCAAPRPISSAKVDTTSK
ncbi:hypothetical protein D9M68_728160 [compost metagenome]